MTSASHLTPQQLITQISELTGLDETRSEDAVTALIEGIAQALQRGRPVNLPGLGTFVVQQGVSPRVAFQISPTFRYELSLDPPQHAPPSTAGGVPTQRPSKVEV